MKVLVLELNLCPFGHQNVHLCNASLHSVQCIVYTQQPGDAPRNALLEMLSVGLIASVSCVLYVLDSAP